MPVTCPPVDVIARYLDDRLPPDDSAGLESHLSSCPDCEGRLRQALKSDPLLPLARNSAGTAWSVPVELRDRLLGLCAASDTNGTFAQDTPPIGSATSVPELNWLLRPTPRPCRSGTLTD